MNQNPFTYGNPIRDPNRFCGRKEEIQQITSRLLSSAHESTSIVGERRIGKTSLLKHIANPDIAETLGLSQDQFCLVYIDFQGLTDITALKFWRRVLRKLRRLMPQDDISKEIKQLLKREEIDLFDLEDLFELVNHEGKNVILLMDEFEYVTLNPNLDLDFFGGLRALAIHFSLSLVPATRRELVDLCHSEDIKGSPFFNIFSTVVLRPFSRQESILMLEKYTAGLEHEFNDLEKEIVMNLGGGYPLFTQMAGNVLYNGKTKGYIEQELKDWVNDSFYQQADDHFKYFWSHTSESEKITLLAVFALNQGKKMKQSTIENLSKLYSRAQKDVDTLTRRGLLIEESSKYNIFSDSFQRWVSYELFAIPGEEESPETVEEWLREGGDMKIGMVKGLLPKFKKKYWFAISKLAKDFSVEVLSQVTAEAIIRRYL